MSGLPEFNYPAFYEAEHKLYLIGHDVLSPTKSDDEHNGEKYSQDKNWYMRRALRMVTRADGVALLAGWESSEGVSQEVQVANMLNITVKPIEDWLI